MPDKNRISDCHSDARSEPKSLWFSAGLLSPARSSREQLSCLSARGRDLQGEREVLLAEAMKDQSVPTDHQHYTQERPQGLNNEHVYRRVCVQKSIVHVRESMHVRVCVHVRQCICVCIRESVCACVSEYNCMCECERVRIYVCV